MSLRLTLGCFLLAALTGLSQESISRQRRQGYYDGTGETCRTPHDVMGVCINIKECPTHLDYLLNKRHEPGIVEYLQAAVCRRIGSEIITCCPVEKSVNFESNNKCQTPRKTPGDCLNIRRCPELLEMLQRRNEPGVTEYLRSSLCGYDNRDPLVCCPLTRPFDDNNGGSNNGEQFNNDNGQNSNDEKSLPGLDVCGLSDSPNNRVVNGQPAALGSWPWMVALGYRSSKKPLQWLCGGSLINSRYVVTAAHCVSNLGSRKLYLARLGDLNLDDGVADRASPLDIPVERAIPHESYNAALHTVDVALVKLSSPVQFSKLIRPICLPTRDTFSDLSGYSPFVVGWGATAYRGPSTTALQEAQIDISDMNSCADAYKNIKGATIDNRVICALSPNGQDACQGDSGGPLILPKRRDSRVNFYLIGVVSYGYKCAEPGYPGIYSKIALYTDWVKNNMRNS